MTCEKCGVQILMRYGSGRFCSSWCARSFSTSKKREEISVKISKTLSGNKTWPCIKCNLSFEKKTSYVAHCRTHTRTWEDLKSDRSRKVWLLKERGHECEICKLSTWMDQKITIELDHIDGNPEHHEKENLRLICPNCHSQTPTWRGRNVGHHANTKRQETMKRYPSYRIGIEAHVG